MVVATLPRSPNDLTADWLAAVFRKTGIDAEITRIGFEHVGAPDSTTSIVLRARIEYASSAASKGPATVIIKLRSPAKETGQFASLYAREVKFYRQLAELVPVATPRAYWAEFDSQTGDVVLVLEDMPDHESPTLQRLATVAEAAALFDDLAQMHAQWWDSRHLRQTSALGHFRSQCRWWQDRLIDRLPVFLQRHGHAIQPADRQIIDALPDGFGSVIEALAARPHTLVHNDLALKNTLIRHVAGAAQFVLIDWQLAAVAPAVRDLSFFVENSVPPDQRAQIESDLLSRYHARLIDLGVTGYSKDDLVNDYRHSVICDLARTLVFGAAEVPDAVSSAIVSHQIRGRSGSARELRLGELLMQ